MTDSEQLQLINLRLTKIEKQNDRIELQLMNKLRIAQIELDRDNISEILQIEQVFETPNGCIVKVR